jgi:hypothetical protein
MGLPEFGETIVGNLARLRRQSVHAFADLNVAMTVHDEIMKAVQFHDGIRNNPMETRQRPLMPVPIKAEQCTSCTSRRNFRAISRFIT